MSGWTHGSRGESCLGGRMVQEVNHVWVDGVDSVFDPEGGLSIKSASNSVHASVSTQLNHDQCFTLIG